ncbi:MAG TPA: O-antigen ligase domain-containing protein [Synechococcales cyanobacterium M55_K2018_004]|nr:O-antigen ligase domain-containing protein [Synechococcales cyanobacterium M55_K2018_004]
MLPPNLALILGFFCVVYLFKWVPTQQAAITSYIVGYTLLPQFGFVFPMLIPGGRMAIVTYAVILGILLFDIKFVKNFRFVWLDLPIIIFCICPFISSIDNNLGVFDGVKEVFSRTISWGAPYFIGRIFLSSLHGMRKLAITFFASGVAYIPLCWYESFRGPLLHWQLYGISPFPDWSQAQRWGGWRPIVFLNHGLEVGLWMMATALIGIWLWKTGSLRRFLGMPMKQLSPVLFLTFLWVKSTGAWILMAIGLAVFFTGRWLRTSFLMLVLLISISFYLYSATLTPEATVGSQILPIMQSTFGQDRASSLQFRLMMEDMLVEKAHQRLLFGWGGSGRSRVLDPITGRDKVVTDSHWIMIFGENGLLGIFSWLTSFLLPLVAFMKCYPTFLWYHPKVAPTAALAVVVLLFMVDSLLNAASPTIYLMAVGGIAGVSSGFHAIEGLWGTSTKVASNYANHDSQTAVK